MLQNQSDPFSFTKVMVQKSGKKLVPGRSSYLVQITNQNINPKQYFRGMAPCSIIYMRSIQFY